jgi:hypothetical protein
MATLAEAITGLRSNRSYVEFAIFTGVNRQTLRDVEWGAPIRLDTLTQIAKACSVTAEAWDELLILWIRSAIGEEEFRRLDIRPASEARATEGGSDVRSTLLRLFGSAPAAHQSLILEALSVPEIMDCIASVTSLFSSGSSDKPSEGNSPAAPQKRPGQKTRSPQPTKKKIYME